MRYLAVLIPLALAAQPAVAVEMIWPEGSACEYIGEVKYGKPHGTGSTRCADGSSYGGEWKDGFPHGQGTYTWPGGRKWVGELNNGSLHGQGTEYNPDGAVRRKGWWCNFEESEGPCLD